MDQNEEKEKFNLSKYLFGSINRKILSIFIVSALILTVAGVYYHYSQSEYILTDEVSEHLKTTATIKSKLFNFYFDELEKNMVVLSDSPAVSNVLSESVSEDISLAKKEIKQKAETAALEVENYLMMHPEYTIQDLQNDPAFDEIASQVVGISGYTSIIDSETGYFYFHPNTALVNTDSHQFEISNPTLWEILNHSIKDSCGEGDGFYLWVDIDGSTREKYLYSICINQKTADGKKLFIVATTYLEEYQSTLELSFQNENFLNSFKENYNLTNLMLVDPQGNIEWDSKEKYPENSNLFSYDFKDTSLNEIYERAIEEKKVVFSDIGYYKYSTVPVFFVAVPKYSENNELVGVIIAESNTTVINSLLSERTGLRSTGEIYLINSEYLVISKLNSNPENALKEEIHTENSINCFESSAFSSNGIQAQDSIIFDDHKGVEVLGTHVYIPKTGWCLLVEIQEQEVLGIQRAELINIAAGLILGIGVIVFFLSYFVSRSISGPIEELASATKELEKGNFDIHVDLHTGDELEDLSNAFNQSASALSKMDEEHKQVEKSKTRFLSITSHELRSPMTPMQGQLQMLMQDYFGKLTKKQKDAMEIVVRNASRLDGIIQDLLEVSRIEAARLKFKFTKTNLKKEVESLIREMNTFMPEKKVTIVLDMEKLPVFEADPDRINQVLRNLINNAIKFSSPNKKIFVTIKKRGGLIFFSVKDQGIGIKPENQQKVFEPFFQEEQTIYREHGGTGLGLTICKGIVESQGGHLNLKSQPGKGSEFTFSFPIIPVKEAKPVNLLFSPENVSHEKSRRLFIEFLGPIGDSEFEELGVKSKEEIFRYIDSIVKKGILTKENGKLFKQKVSDVFDKKR